MKIVHRIIKQSVYIHTQGIRYSGVGVRFGSMEEVKEKTKKSYFFTVFAIVNELLITENCRIRPAYWLMQVHDEMRPSSHRGCYARELFITSGNGYTRSARSAGPPS